MVSVRDIQGLWCETGSENEWNVDGIVVERAKGSKGQKKKPIVLSDGPAGVEWGNGNLIGNLEDGCLVWRNRRGDATYHWSKGDGVVAPAAPMLDTLPPMLPIQLPIKVQKQNNKDDLSPRSTNSAQSKETDEMAAGVAGLMLNAGTLEPPTDEIIFAEVKMLLEMARNRLMAGDVYTSMRYITLAQQVQPTFSSFAGVEH
jgi:hypothetical protein